METCVPTFVDPSASPLPQALALTSFLPNYILWGLISLFSSSSTWGARGIIFGLSPEAAAFPGGGIGCGYGEERRGFLNPSARLRSQVLCNLRTHLGKVTLVFSPLK